MSLLMNRPLGIISLHFLFVTYREKLTASSFLESYPNLIIYQQRHIIIFHAPLLYILRHNNSILIKSKG